MNNESSKSTSFVPRLILSAVLFIAPAIAVLIFTFDLFLRIPFSLVWIVLLGIIILLSTSLIMLAVQEYSWLRARIAQAAIDKQRSDDSPPDDQILMSAWALFIQYDTAALNLKQRHVNYRVLVLVLNFFASFLAVALGTAQIETAPGGFAHLQPVGLFLVPFSFSVYVVWRIWKVWERNKNQSQTVQQEQQTDSQKGADFQKSADSPVPQQQSEPPSVVTQITEIQNGINSWMEKNQRIVVSSLIVLGITGGVALALPSFRTTIGSSAQEVLRLILFLLPLISTGIIAYLSKFIPSQVWARYRYVAEAIRREIFLYRSGTIREIPDRKNPKNVVIKCFENRAPECQQYLSGRLTELENALDTMPVTIFEPPIMPDWKQLGKKMKSDDLKGINPEDYINKRLLDQYQWYTGKSIGEYRAMGRWQIVALIIGGAGSLLSFLGHESWVAITTSAAVTVTALSDLMMYGRTYMIYHEAARKLRQRYDRWNIEFPKKDAEKENQKTDAEKKKDAEKEKLLFSQLVHDIENIFEEEIEDWIKQTKEPNEETTSGKSRSAAQA